MQMEKRLQYFVLALAIFTITFAAFFLFVIQKETSFQDRIVDEMRQRLTYFKSTPLVKIGNESSHADTLLFRFYEARGFRPSWISAQGPLSISDSLIKAIHDAEFEGLNPQDYHASLLDSLSAKIRYDLQVKRPVNIKLLADLEIFLTDAFLIYSNHLLSGRVNPETIAPEWLTPRPEVDLVAILERAVNSGQIRKSLEDLLPRLPCYAALRNEIAHYKAITLAGGWPEIHAGPKLKKGDQGTGVAALSARLVASGDLPNKFGITKSVYDDTLEMAVRRFQKRHGLKEDGEVGASTMALLNIPSLNYVHKIQVNMERWRWLPRDLGEKYILINIAAFSLEIVDHGETVLKMPVVVGRDYRQTPVFSSKMTYLVLNPYWNVPPTIAGEDILPEVKKNTHYFARKNMVVLKNWSDTTPIDPYQVNWAAITKDNLPYKFRQLPGKDNALGRIKFMLPNKYDVYLHDTPQRYHFNAVERAYSSGCIRLARPIELAEYVLKSDSKWTREAIIAALDRVENYYIPLPDPIPVHFFYCTAWVEEGIVHFRNDIYNRDLLIENALRKEMMLQQ